MKMGVVRIASTLPLLLRLVQAGAFLRASRSRVDRISVRSEPDTSCGAGFDKLIDGSKAYFNTAYDALWDNPSRSADRSVWKEQIQCWFANMHTQGCGNLPSHAETRKRPLTQKCTDLKVSWPKVAALATKDEWAWYSRNYPA